MKKTLYLMRHGQTLFNVRRKVQGFCDSPLTQLGIDQATKAAQYFVDNGIQFESAYSSTSERACDTLELITDLDYKRVKGLKEWNFGTFEGESEDLNPKLPYGNFFVPFGGEEEFELRDRIVHTLSNIMEEEKHNVILAVSHGASCAQFMRAWKHKSAIVADKPLKNCCILKFEYENNEFTLVDLINHNFDNL